MAVNARVKMFSARPTSLTPHHKLKVNTVLRHYLRCQYGVQPRGVCVFFFFHFFFPLCPPVSTPAMALLPLLSLIIVQALTHLRLITKLHISSMFTWHPVLCAVYTGNKCIHIIRGCWNCPGAVWTVSLNRDRMFAPGKKKQKTMSSWSLQKT